MRLEYILPHQLREKIAAGRPLLVPAGCIECHGPHLGLGLDTIVVHELCLRVAREVDAVVAPPFWYGPTGYAVSGPEQGTVDVDPAAFGRHAQDVLRAFWRMGFARTYVIVHHQGMDGPEAAALRLAAAELSFQMPLESEGEGWWGERDRATHPPAFGRIIVAPSILGAAAPHVSGDHAGRTETSLLLALVPEAVEMSRLDAGAQWYCREPPTPSAEGSAVAGEAMLAAMAAAWVERIRRECPS